MTKKSMLGNFLLILTALIWGSAFVAQSVGGALGTFSFNGIRSFIGSAALLVVIVAMKIMKKETLKADRNLLLGGVLCGVVLFFASTLQQYGLNQGVSSGKAGFITTLYIIFVPVVYFFMKKGVSPRIWISVTLALVGLYLLCLGGEGDAEGNFIKVLMSSFRFGMGEAAILLGAVVFSAHIIIIDYYAPKVDCVKMSAIQFFVVGLMSLPFMIFMEKPTFAAISFQMTPLLYAGVMSCSVAYTLQMIGQKITKPTVASLLLSLESVFAVMSGALILGERHSAVEYIGCFIVFAGVIIAQLPEKDKNK